jgi:peptidoglycan/xylan/chitin deacetylase (PgdA/CDA1 family)
VLLSAPVVGELTFHPKLAAGQRPRSQSSKEFAKPGTHLDLIPSPYGRLRKNRPLLNTRILHSAMLFLRRLAPLFFIFLPLGPTLLSAENSSPPTASERAKPAGTPEQHSLYSDVHVDEPYIALTFDDGPHATLTPRLLDLLASRHIKVTFFVLGECVEQNPQVLQRAAREGHEIANHSWSHPQLNHLSDEGVRSQLRRTDDLIKSLIGIRPTLFRPPYGALTSRQKKWIPDEFGYKIILWDVDPLDWKEPGPAAVTNRILKNARAGSIILSHDIHRGTIESVPATIDQLLAKHFKFVTVSELISLATPVPPKPSRKAAAATAASPAAPTAPSVTPAAQPVAPAPSPTNSPSH